MLMQVFKMRRDSCSGISVRQFLQDSNMYTEICDHWLDHSICIDIVPLHLPVNISWTLITRPLFRRSLQLRWKYWAADGKPNVNKRFCSVHCQLAARWILTPNMLRVFSGKKHFWLRCYCLRIHVAIESFARSDQQLRFQDVSASAYSKWMWPFRQKAAAKSTTTKKNA